MQPTTFLCSKSSTSGCIKLPHFSLLALWLPFRSAKIKGKKAKEAAKHNYLFICFLNPPIADTQDLLMSHFR